MRDIMAKVPAFLFLLGIAAIPVIIVALFSLVGGIWVAGYVSGIITVPLVIFGAMRAIGTLTDSDGFFGVLVFGLVAILISLAAAIWSFVAFFLG